PCWGWRSVLKIFAGVFTLPRSPLILGHQVVGIVKRLGPKAKRFKIGQRVGAAWVGKTCGACRFCLSNRENLCESALFTGYHYDGGFAEFCTANEDYCYLLPDCYSDSQVAPLLCGGLIGFRALRKTGSAQKLGFYGFGSSAHILIQIAKHQGKEVYAFIRHGDESAQSLAKKLGAVWAGSSEEMPPVLLDAAIIFAPVGKLVPQALRAVDKGGSVVCAGIHMSDIPSFPYELIYGERLVQSVANLTRDDGEKFFEIASRLLIHTQVASYSLEEANRALCDLREGKITGSAVISVSEQ
ncbi:MAG: zinc-dependent alcohol dehydrogenase family protein, partial [Parachlamydiales bacterium]